MSCKSIIGAARTIQTAVLAVEYLRARCCQPHSDVHESRVQYRFKEPTESNGWWSADIYVDGELGLADSSLFVSICRAFVAGRGEVWA